MARLTTFVAVLVFAALTAVVSLQVLNRMALHLPLIWSEEVARFLFFWSTPTVPEGVHGASATEANAGTYVFIER